MRTFDGTESAGRWWFAVRCKQVGFRVGVGRAEDDALSGGQTGGPSLGRSRWKSTSGSKSGD